ncbi:MAG: DUF3747 domain-containing protein [Chloroflexaceae bacterium]|nr:DUF3747 domain-containing protein [Chloroflexaceae bacterium]
MQFFSVKLAALASAILVSLVPTDPAQAGLFEEEPVEQSQVTAVAEPYGDPDNRQYNLLVIEQIPGQQTCWQESGSSPVTVEPLLRTFDFTGHCRRSTDSNGYSIRIDGQDLGLDYILRIVKNNGNLVLLATPRGVSNLPEIVVGRSNGFEEGKFIKLTLNPGWQFTRRTYQGKPLGHYYLSNSHNNTTTEPGVNSPTNPVVPGVNPPTSPAPGVNPPANPLPDLTFPTNSVPGANSQTPQFFPSTPL